jgi:hypothetical protein
MATASWGTDSFGYPSVGPFLGAANDTADYQLTYFWQGRIGSVGGHTTISATYQWFPADGGPPITMTPSDSNGADVSIQYVNQVVDGPTGQNALDIAVYSGPDVTGDFVITVTFDGEVSPRRLRLEYVGEYGVRHNAPAPTKRAIRFDLTTKRISEVPALGDVRAVQTDLLADRLFLAEGTTVKALGDGAPATAIWRSRKFISPHPQGFGWLKLNGPLTAPVTMRVYVDGVLAHTATVANRNPQRLPARQGRAWEIELESTSRVTYAAIAQTAPELSE